VASAPLAQTPAPGLVHDHDRPPVEAERFVKQQMDEVVGRALTDEIDRRREIGGNSRWWSRTRAGGCSSARGTQGRADAPRRPGRPPRAFTAFPVAHQKLVWSTNPLERLNKEVKRHTDVVGVLPNPAALLRLADAVLVDAHDERQVAPTRATNPPTTLPLRTLDGPTRREADRGGGQARTHDGINSTTRRDVTRSHWPCHGSGGSRERRIVAPTDLA
jgi:hypothetical protein